MRKIILNIYILGCQIGWHQFIGNCYKYTENIFDSWTEARNFCTDNGGDLASIPDEETNDFLLSLISSRTFIGGVLDSSTGAWSWTDGTLFSFTKWASHQPSGERRQYVLELTEDGTWNNLGSDGFQNQRHALCQRPATQTWSGDGKCFFKLNWSPY